MKLLIDKKEIMQRVAQLGATLTEYYKDKPLTVVGIMNGALIFTSDLIKEISLPIYFDTIAVKSYNGTKSSGEISFRSTLKLPIKDRHLLIVDDILDTGITLLELQKYFEKEGALSVKHCVILEKEVERKKGIKHANWSGFTIPDLYVVGYGMDANEEYRNLSEIYILE